MFDKVYKVYDGILSRVGLDESGKAIFTLVFVASIAVLFFRARYNKWDKLSDTLKMATKALFVIYLFILILEILSICFPR